MRNVDPAKIPETGERHDQTLLEVGKGKSYNPDVAKKAECILIKTIIDNGERAGKKLSCPFFPSQEFKFREFTNAIGVNGIVLKGDRKDIVKKLKPFETRARFSSMVNPVEFETDRGRYIRYNMTFFDDPEGESTLDVTNNADQFQR